MPGKGARHYHIPCRPEPLKQALLVPRDVVNLQPNLRLEVAEGFTVGLRLQSLSQESPDPRTPTSPKKSQEGLPGSSGPECQDSVEKWGKKKTNKHKEFWRDTPWCACRLSRGHVPSVPGTFCPFSIDLHINQASLGRPEFVPGTPPGHPTAKFLYVIFLYRFFFLSIKKSPNTDFDTFLTLFFRDFFDAF